MSERFKESMTNAERFKESATSRTQELLHRIRVLGHCSNKSLYEYKEEDVRKIFRAIDLELRLMKDRFRRRLAKQENFRL